MNYDHRRRDMRIENDRAFALAETRRLRQKPAQIPAAALELPLNVMQQAQLRRRSSASVCASSYGRELMYAVAHAIHHYALLAVMCGLLGVRVPFGFGIAPSTLQHQAEQEKAA